MNSRVFRVGGVLILVGIALFSVSIPINPNFHGNSSKVFPSAEYTSVVDGLYVTYIPANLTQQESDYMIVLNPSLIAIPNNLSLVSVPKLSGMNASNYLQLGIVGPYNNSAAIYFNDVPSGTYALVEAQNDTIAFAVTPVIPLEIAGILSFSGGLIGFAGFITMIVGATLRSKPPQIEL